MSKDWWTRRGFNTREEWLNDRNRKYREKTQKTCSMCENKFHGNRNYCSNKCNILANVKITDSGCWEWNKCIRKDGYGSAKDLNDRTQKKGHRQKSKTISVISYETFKGDTLELCVCHTCDNRRCCNPEHLWLGSKKDNAQDALKKGRLKWDHTSRFT